MDFVYAEKPSRNEHYFRNVQLKTKTKKIVETFGGDSQKEKWLGRNLKKNTGFKPIYSCHGYGGRCRNCRDQWDSIHQQNQQIKRNVKYDIQEWKSASLD